MTNQPVAGRHRLWGYALVWVVAAAVAVTVGILAVSSVGASVRDRGPLGNEVPAAEQADGASTPESDAEKVRRTLDGPFGTFEVACRGVVAYGLGTSTVAGWSTISFESGPDDDVDAVFARGARSIELEVYCNQGRPTVGDREYKTLPDD